MWSCKVAQGIDPNSDLGRQTLWHPLAPSETNIASEVIQHHFSCLLFVTKPTHIQGEGNVFFPFQAAF